MRLWSIQLWVLAVWLTVLRVDGQTELPLPGAPAPGTLHLPARLFDGFSLVSKSRQFVVHSERPSALGLSVLKPSDGHQEIEPDPRTLVIICDRVRSAVVKRLDLPDRWKGKIHVHIASPGSPVGPIRIVPEIFGSAWQFRVYLPRKLPWTALTRALAEAVLLEFANANSGHQAVPVPLWITEGVHRILLEDEGRTLISELNTVSHRNERKLLPIQLPREVFQNEIPLSFADLGQTGPDAANNPAEWRRFQASAQLCVHELLASRATRGVLRDTLLLLPNSLNWQTVFLQAGRTQFLSLLEVEKWWAVSTAAFRDGPPGQPWPDRRIHDRLRDIGSETADVRSQTNAPFRRVTVPLSQLIAEWPASDSRPVVFRKLSQLRLLASHASPATLPMIQDYFRTLERLSFPVIASKSPGSGRNPIDPRQRLVIENAVRDLKTLEDRLARLPR